MKIKRIVGMLLFIVGIVLYFIGSDIASKVSEGDARISQAQEGVDVARGLSDLSPYTREAGNVITDVAQQKIDQKRGEASSYRARANWFRISGIVCSILGLLLFLFSFFQKRTR